MTRRNYLLLDCGGTIAMSAERVRKPQSRSVVAELLSRLGASEDFDYLRLYSIDSSDMSSGHWNAILQQLVKAIRGGYSSVLVTHGTDSLSYSAAAIARNFRERPAATLVITGSKLPVLARGSDAEINLADAIAVCRSGLQGCFGVFSRTIFSMSDMTKVYGSELFSSAKPPPARIGKDGSVDLSRFREVGSAVASQTPKKFGDRCALLACFPGMRALNGQEISKVLADSRDTLLVKGLGHGNLPLRVADSLSEWFGSEKQRGVRLVICSQFDLNARAYANYTATAKLVEQGAVLAEDESFPYCFVRFSETEKPDKRS